MSDNNTNNHLAVGWKNELEIIKTHVNFGFPDSTTSRFGEWRSLPELPTGRELNPNCEAERGSILARLPHNDVTSPYNSKEEYLETHYRLQREEGITMLRFAIKEYRNDPKMNDTENICVYTKVFVKGYSMTRQGALCRVQFLAERAGKKIRWTHTRRLRPGTLVAISTAANNFSTICKPAIISDRLFPSEVQLQWADIGESVMDPNEELVMIEARRAYFESVRHCLVGLQHVAATDTPFDKYLVEGSHVDQTPNYVLDRPEMNITPLFHHLPQNDVERERLLDSYRSYDILGGIPTVVGKHTSLDNSQLEAVHRILTKEMAIIQGPPGTGKTFTSVQALSALIETHNVSGYQGEVIVVAAETNHAVDQILTQLLKLQYNIVRLGSRTRDNNIRKYNMYNYRRKFRHTKDKNSDSLERALKDSITKLQNLVKEVYPDGLLDPHALQHHGIITEEQLSSIADSAWTYHAPPGRPHGVLSQWLGDCLVDLSIRRERDPIFDTEEIAEEDDIDVADLDHDLDDPAFDDTDDQDRVSGIWVSIGGQWGGSNEFGYKESNFLFKRESTRPSLWDTDPRLRGAIYEHWKKQLASRRHNDFCVLLANHARIIKNIKINRWIRDVQCIRNNRVNIIGCTTTGLCKYRGLLAALKPKTILIEEAAQSREANITSALYQDLQQLILVGDDQQLAPHTDIPGLSGDRYNLSVSMFKRLVRYLHIPFTVLNMQRRMIPSIREVLNPFYPSLRDHPVVRQLAHRPPIPGMPFASYLFHHTWPEGMDKESLSRYNIQEAEMVVRFAAYLIANDVPTEKITILTFYRGQRKIILQMARRILPNPGLLHLNVFTVDSYQGEENDIVILSLVRSNGPNAPGRAGFVENMNRGVVSISRARRGFFIFGNIVNLENATETSAYMWGSVRQVFERQGHFGRRGLPIRCQNHGTLSYIDSPDAFANNLGGCSKPCSGRFEDCGHVCGRLCHPLPHSKLICQQPCARKLRCGHGCSKACGDECECPSDCSAVLGQMLPPAGSQIQRSSWANYNAADDDARRLQARHISSSLVGSDSYPSRENRAVAIRDEFRAVTLDTAGKRMVGERVLIDSSLDKVTGISGRFQTIPKSMAVPDINDVNGASVALSSRQRLPQPTRTLVHNGGTDTFKVDQTISRGRRTQLTTTSETTAKNPEPASPHHTGGIARGWQQLPQARLGGSSFVSVNSIPRSGHGVSAGPYHSTINSQSHGGHSRLAYHPQLQTEQASVNNSDALSSYTQGAEWETSSIDSDEPANADLGDMNVVEPADDGDVKDLIQF